MDGSNELRQLAHLLRVIAHTARAILSISKFDACDVDTLVYDTENIADSFDAVAGGGRPLPAARPPDACDSR